MMWAIIGPLKIFVQHNKYNISFRLSADKQGESSDPGYDCSQQSESESSENGIVLEMEDDPTSRSQVSLDEQLEGSEMNAPIPFLSGDLEGKLYLTECVKAIITKNLKCMYTCMYVYMYMYCSRHLFL